MRFHDLGLLSYYFITKAWSSLVPGEAIIRFPSVLAMSIVVVVVMQMVTEFTDVRTGILAAAITLIMPSVPLFAQDARPYAFVTLSACLSVRFWLLRVTDAKPRYVVLLTLFLVTGTLMHAYSAVLILVFLIGAIVLRNDSAPGLLRATVVASSASCLFVVPFLAFADRYARGQATAPAVSPRSLAYIVAAFPAGVLKPWLAPEFAALTLAAGAAGAFLILRRPAIRGRPLTIVSLIWLVVPPVVLTAVQVVLDKPTLLARYWEFCVPALAIVVTICVARVSSWRPWAAFAACLLLALLALPTQIFIRGDDGHDGTLWQRLPDVLASARLRAFPITINGTAPDALLIYGQYRGRLFIRRSATGCGLIAPILQPADSPVVLRAARLAHGLIVYQTRTSSTTMPSAANFRRLVNVKSGIYHLQVSCEYFGDSLGIFGVRGHSLRPGTVARIARQIEIAADGQARCVAE
jgi:Dolichyl-phosphate-mannose-protein mannosyltransferase